MRHFFVISSLTSKPSFRSLMHMLCAIYALVLAASSTTIHAQSAGTRSTAGSGSVEQDSTPPARAAQPGDSSGTPPKSSVSNSQQPQEQSIDGAQTKRILGLIPNFRAVSVGQKLPPQSVKDKFTTATEDSFDYSSVFIPALLAAYSLGTNATPEFHHGAAGYGRYFWHAAVDQTSENYMVEFVVPAVTHEDTRFYTLGSGGFFKRARYALSRTVITRSDSGNDTFNLSEVIGSGASSGLSSLYYPSRERSIENTGKEWGLDIGIDGAAYMVKEFWPDINRHVFHQGDARSRAHTSGE